MKLTSFVFGHLPFEIAPVFLIITFVVFSNTAVATPPPIDSLKYDGEVNVVYGLLPIPPSEKIKEKSLKWGPGCQPVGSWEISDGRLWLLGLYQCGVVKLDEVYDGVTEPLMASWVSGRLVTNHGKMLCGERGVPELESIWETTIEITVKNGIVESIKETNNKDDPAVPKNTQSDNVPCNLNQRGRVQ